MLNFRHFKNLLTLASGALITLILGTMLTSAQNSAPNPAQQWWKHIQYLASDEMSGRETGSEGHRRAEQYVATAFQNAGLRLPERKGTYSR